MQSCELVMSISALACCIAEGRSPEEIALISSIYSQLGDTLNTIAAHQALCQPCDSEKKEDSGKSGSSGQAGSSGQTNRSD